MATTQFRVERCERCQRETIHAVDGSQRVCSVCDEAVFERMAILAGRRGFPR